MSVLSLWRALGLPEIRTAKHRDALKDQIVRMGVQRLPVGSPWVVASEPSVRPVKLVEWRLIGARHDTLLLGYYWQQTETYVANTEDALAQYLTECLTA